MILFAIIIFFAALSMLKKPKSDNQQKTVSNKPLLVIKLFIAGIIVGLVGAGGGFLFIPLLIYAAKLPMKKAVPTSLLIIAINSLIGFIGDVQNLAIDWIFLLKFTFVSIIGIFLGISLQKFINERQLKAGFGWFVLVMALFIFTRELFLM